MATYLAAGAGPADWTSTSTWKKVCSGAGANSGFNAAFVTAEDWISDVNTYHASPAFTIPNGEVIDGAAIMLRPQAQSGSVTLALFDGAVELTTCTINFSAINANSATTDWHLVFFKFGASQTGDGGSDYTLKIKTSAAWLTLVGRISGTAFDMWRHLRTTADATAAPTTGDHLIIAGENSSTTYTVTMNETATTQYGHVYIGNKGVLTYGTSAATNYVLRAAGTLLISPQGSFRMGTVGAEIPRDSTAVFEFVLASHAQYRVECYGEMILQGLSRTSGKNVPWALLAANMTAGATSATIDRDTGWKSGDLVAFAGTKWTYGEGESKTLNADAGANSLAWTGGSTYGHKYDTPTPGEVINLTRNVKFRTTGTYNAGIAMRGKTPSCDWDWVEFQYMGYTNNSGVPSTDNGSYATVDIRYCAFRDTRWTHCYLQNVFNGTATCKFNVFFNTIENLNCLIAYNPLNDVVFEDNVGFGSTGAFNEGIHTGYPSKSYVRRNRMAGGNSAYGRNTEHDGAYKAFEDNISHGMQYYGLWSNSRFTGTIHGLVAWGHGGQGMGFYQQNDNALYDAVFEDCAFYGMQYGGFNLNGPCHGVRFKNCTVHSRTEQTGDYVIAFYDSHYYHDLLFDNCDFNGSAAFDYAALRQESGLHAYGSACKDVRFRDCVWPTGALLSNFPTGLATGSWIAFEKHSTAPYERRLTDVGWIEIDTTTYRVSSPSEKVSPLLATLTRKMQSGMRQVLCNSGVTRSVSVWVKHSANYIGASPRLIQKANPAIGIDEDVVVATNEPSYPQVLVVAGGGGGGKAEPNNGGDGGGGGGAGGVRWTRLNIQDGDYDVVVGAGGLGSTSNASKGATGEDSSFDTVVAEGGGGGGSDNDAPTGANKGADGGSGGGAANCYNQATAASNGTENQGYAGGDALTNTTSWRGGSGGGGRGAVGVTRSGSAGGAGGPGVTRMGRVVAAGGKGGNCESTQNPGADAAPNTGNGGDGGNAGAGGGGVGGDGGSGIVIVRYPGSPTCTGGTITESGGYTYHTFTASGTFSASDLPYDAGLGANYIEIDQTQWAELTGECATPNADGVLELCVDCDGGVGAINVDDWTFT